MIYLIIYLVIGAFLNTAMQFMVTEEELIESYKVQKLEMTINNDIFRQLLVVFFWPLCILIMLFLLLVELFSSD